ncbi:hypothetical protein VTP01DRAFT_1950 [Rhizomucor pusillus]|uniref:uncharacterized protein n=1 Tax=Rhizomucor pusillus TaxID=4840 RepID=UPI003742EBBD
MKFRTRIMRKRVFIESGGDPSLVGAPKWGRILSVEALGWSSMDYRVRASKMRIFIQKDGPISWPAVYLFRAVACVAGWNSFQERRLIRKETVARLSIDGHDDMDDLHWVCIGTNSLGFTSIPPPKESSPFWSASSNLDHLHSHANGSPQYTTVSCDEPKNKRLIISLELPLITIIYCTELDFDNGCYIRLFLDPAFRFIALIAAILNLTAPIIHQIMISGCDDD